METSTKPTHSIRTLDESDLDTVVGGMECTQDDPNGDGVIDGEELENMMKRANNIAV